MTRRYGSCLAKDLRDFLAFKRSLGIQYNSAEWVLRRFDRFVAQTFNARRPIALKVAIEAWLATLHCRPVTITNNFVVLRKFCLFMRRRDPNGYVPERDLVPCIYHSHHLPHIFSPAEIRILLKAIGHMQPAFRARTYRALLLILYCTGLRTGEAVRLRIRDVDLRESVFWIDVSKAKSRWVPFEETLTTELSAYLRERYRVSQASEESRFLVQPNGSPCGRPIVSNRITALLRQTGLKPRTGRVGPRPYDTRHSFAVNRLTQWYRQGVDVQKRVAWLSAYLGHDDLLGTQDYLHLTPELRRRVSTRHEAYIGRCWEGPSDEYFNDNDGA
jgi:site-specific recombinase XerD